MSNNLSLSQVVAAQDQKETTINDQAAELDAALTEEFDADVSAGNVALTAAEYRRAIHIKATGAATAGRTVTLQAIKRLVAISNYSTTDSVDFILGSATITIEPAAGATEPSGAIVYTDGTANGLYRLTTLGAAAFDELTGVNLSSPTQGQMLRFDGSGDLVNEDTPFDIAVFLPGTYTDGALMAQIVFDRSVSFPVDLASSQGYSGVTATGATVLDVQKNGANIGTITFTNAGNTATFVLAGGASFVAGDRLSIINENPADATLADVSITLRGTRV